MNRLPWQGRSRHLTCAALVRLTPRTPGAKIADEDLFGTVVRDRFRPAAKEDVQCVEVTGGRGTAGRAGAGGFEGGKGNGSRLSEDRQEGIGLALQFTRCRRRSSGIACYVFLFNFSIAFQSFK